MRIISNFKDYYDSCLAYGADKSLVYTRKEKRQNLSDTYFYPKEFYHSSSYGNKETDYVVELRRSVVGFCGRIYPALWVRTSCFDSGDKNYIVYSVDEFKELFPKFYAKEPTFLLRDHNQQINLWLNDLSWPIWKNIKKLDIDAYKKLFIGRKIPIFRVSQHNYPERKTEIVENCSLENCEFYKVFDAFQAFQEIAMYQADSLCDKEDPEMPVGNDVIVARSKGYNKFSFRQDKGTKKGKRKLNKARKRNKKES